MFRYRFPSLGTFAAALQVQLQQMADSEYLKATVGPALTLAMTALVVEQPNDAVEVRSKMGLWH